MAGDIESEVLMFTVKMATVPAPVVISSPIEGAMMTAGTVNVSGTAWPLGLGIRRRVRRCASQTKTRGNIRPSDVLNIGVTPP